jgi:hypothetical protein
LPAILPQDTLRPLSHDLQIEDLIAQDEAEVVYRAITAAGQPVLLRRFFPFGAGGKGLGESEREVFATVVWRLIECRHPALCPVVAGGVDPVDGIPFVALARLEGESLAEKLQQGPLPPGEAISMLDALLVAAGVVSAALGHDGLWLETESRTIQWTDCGYGPAPVFRIAPHRCLWTGGEWRPAAELIHLTELALGWQGVMVPEQAADGLGTWINWLRAHPAATLAGAADALAASTRHQPPPLVRVATQTAAASFAQRPAAPPRRAKLALPVILACVALATGGGLWWHATRSPRMPAMATQPADQASVGHGLDIPSSAGAPLPHGAARETPAQPRPSPLAEGPGPERAKERAYQADEIDLIMGRFRQEILMEGVVARVALSANRRVWYLEFSATRPPDKARAFLPVGAMGAARELDEVNALVGKRIRVRGKVDLERTGPGKSHRPKVLLNGPDAVHVLR